MLAPALSLTITHSVVLSRSQHKTFPYHAESSSLLQCLPRFPPRRATVYGLIRPSAIVNRHPNLFITQIKDVGGGGSCVVLRLAGGRRGRAARAARRHHFPFGIDGTSHFPHAPMAAIRHRRRRPRHHLPFPFSVMRRRRRHQHSAASLRVVSSIKAVRPSPISLDVSPYRPTSHSETRISEEKISSDRRPPPRRCAQVGCRYSYCDYEAKR